MKSKESKEQSKIVVPLSLVIEAIESADEEWNQYLDIREMEVVCLPQFPFMGEYEEEEQELADRVEEEWLTRFFRLPSNFDIHEYRIMEDFVWSLPEGRTQDLLEGAIRGKGAFRRFKDAICRLDIEQQWYDFEEAKYREIAIEWCDSYGFGYSG